MNTRTKLVELTNLSKKFGDIVAIDRVDLELFSGEIVGLVGANGSGKSTLVNILFGNIIPDTGRISVLGTQSKFKSTNDAISLGIRMLPQNVELYKSLNVLENIFIGQELTVHFGFLRLMAWKKMEKTARSLLKKVDAENVSPFAMIGNLSGGQQKAVLLARLLATDTKLLIFDEPMASLGIKQKLTLLKIIKSESEKGCSIVFISHNIAEVIENCDRVIVLQHGKIKKDVLCRNTDLQEVSSLILKS